MLKSELHIQRKKSHRSRWLHQILIGEIVISYFYELFNRFGFSLLPPMQFLRGDRSWSPLCALCRFRLFLEFGDFFLLLLYHLGKLRFAFFSCLCVHIKFLLAVVGESWKVASSDFLAFYWIFHGFFSILLKIPFLRLLRLKN